MPLTNAERQKRYRERLKAEKPEKYEVIRLKHLIKVKQNKKKIKEMTDEEQKEQREKWKRDSNKRNEKHKANRQSDRNNTEITPKRQRKNVTEALLAKYEAIKQENNTLIRLNKNLKRMLYRKNAEIDHLKWKLTYQSRRDKKEIQPSQSNELLARSVGGPAQTDSTLLKTNGLEELPSLNNETLPNDSAAEQAQADVTPLSKTNQFLDELPSINDKEKERVKKKLLLLNTLTHSIKDTYTKAKTQREKKILKNIALNETARKYNIKTTISRTLGLKGRVRVAKNKNKNKKYVHDIYKFYTRDDVSRATAGKRECITRKKHKMQKRFLIDTMQKLHKKYISEGGKASYATFARHRPFYVIVPTLKDRNTCGCIKHSNITFKANKLKQLTATETSDIDVLMAQITCSESYDCMYSKCGKCLTKAKDVVTIDTNYSETPVQWYEWRLITKEYTKIIDNKEIVKTTKKYVKAAVDGTIASLVEAFLKEMLTFKIHYFNMKYQYRAYKKYLESLEDDEVLLVCDFSENYKFKLSEEIQACHFQEEQITLHTSVLYKKNEKPKPICTISAVNEHGPGAIWAHLDPILVNINTTATQVKKIHVFSDGPTTQYRQKHNFYLFTKRLSDYGFEGTWNFFEAAHGKGAADGVGGAVKRKLDQCAAHGQDISSAEEAFTYLRDNINIEVHLVSASKILHISNMIPDNVIALKGTMKVHQVIYTAKDKQNITYRALTCICKKDDNCKCEGDTGRHDLLQSKKSNEITFNLNESVYTVDETQKEVPAKKIKQGNNIQSKSNNNVTVLSSVVLMPGDSYITRPLSLKPIDPNFDISLCNNINKTPMKSTKEYNNNTGKKKALKRARSSSSNSTSVDSKFSVYDDSEYDQWDIRSSDSNLDENAQSNIIVTKAQVHARKTSYKLLNKTEILKKQNNDNDIDVQVTINLQNTFEETKNLAETEIVLNRIEKQMTPTPDSTHEKHNEKTNDKLNHKTEILKKQKNDHGIDEQVTVISEYTLEDTETLSKTKKQMTPDNTNEKTKTEKELNLNDTRRAPLKKLLNEENNDYEAFSVGKKVIVRYYQRNKTWKYYVGIIENISKSRNYTINYYKTKRKNENVTFFLPKKKDIDEVVPYISIVKVVEMKKIRNKPEYVLLYDSDLVYFTE